MSDIYEWAIRWGVPMAAVQDLQREMRYHDDSPVPPEGARQETYVSAEVRIEASQKGCRLWRNNVGAYQDETGRWIRYGLCNDSKKLNDEIKSGDLIGIRPRLIGPSDVGTVIGQFMSREVKRPDWRYSGTDREAAQLRWAEHVMSLGGDASFATGVGTI